MFSDLDLLLSRSKGELCFSHDRNYIMKQWLIPVFASHAHVFMQKVLVACIQMLFLGESIKKKCSTDMF